ncbi:PLxRFG domain-containing protein [Cupriavidus numazuensis]|uniref:Transglycosylase SLT domain-containing protein n=1 Tax=Cupriavidus numazuensis TaxID=221992 RepID=A0ABM8TB23_9BURK|nr:PLxRFG domain-containing protein [Cupriavidus numazuensis]CAG2132577.1 hypothetical protein LMG26411_00641 [Cupriavidus numazuensis]
MALQDFGSLSLTNTPAGAQDKAPGSPRRSGGTTPIDAATVSRIIAEEGADAIKPIVMGIYGQETNSGTNARTSTDGAIGPMQVIPDTFNRLKRGNERVDSPEDNFRVGVRYLKTMADRFGPDAGRLAAGYFSGEGNVNTSGDTPYKEDRKDSNGKYVSSYVKDVLARVGNAVVPDAKAAQPAQDISKAPKYRDFIAKPQWAGLDDSQKDQARNAYFDRYVAPHLPAAERDGQRAAFLQRASEIEGPNAKVEQPGLMSRIGSGLADAGRAVLGAMGQGEAGAEGAAIDPAALSAPSATTAPAGKLGVMGQPGAAPADKSYTSRAPVTPEFRDQVNRAYDAATPAERQRMAQTDGVVGQLVRERTGQFNDAPQVPTAGKFDTRAEARAGRLAAEGADHQTADAFARTGAERGVTPGAELGTMGASNFDFAAQEAFNKGPLSHPLIRAAVKGYEGYKVGSLGLAQALFDATGNQEFADIASQGIADSQRRTAAIGEKGDGLQRNFEGAVSSIAQQLPALLAGVATGTEVVPLAAMFTQTFGQEYGQGRAQGLDGGQAATRAGIFGAFEVIGEKFGLGNTLQAMKLAAKGAGTQDIASVLAKGILKEIPGEQLTTLGQFLTDKVPGIGANLEAGLAQYLQQAGDTLAQTVMQGGLMMGGTTGVSAGVRHLQGAQSQSSQALAADQAREQALNKAANFWQAPQRPAHASTQAAEQVVREMAAEAGMDPTELLPAQRTVPAAPAAPVPAQAAAPVPPAAAPAADVPQAEPPVQAAAQPAPAVPATYDPQQVLDFAQTRYARLAAKRDGEALVQAGPDGKPVDGEIAGQALTPDEQQEMTVLEQSRGDVAALARFYGFDEDAADGNPAPDQSNDVNGRGPTPDAAVAGDEAAGSAGALPAGADGGSAGVPTAPASGGNAVPGSDGNTDGQPALTPTDSTAAPPALADMTDEQLRERAAYIRDQARANGGWNKMATAERDRVDAEIQRRTADQTAAQVEAAAHEAATSPVNDRPEPTDAQKAAGNYKMGHATVHGLDITIENPRGSTRSGKDADGKPWSVEMANHYGYIKRTEGADGDHVDVFIGPKPESTKVFVVDQIDPRTGRYDEHKVLLGFPSLAAARAGYLANYEQGWKGAGAITAMSMDEFKAWLKDGDTTKPLNPKVGKPKTEKQAKAAREQARREAKAPATEVSKEPAPAKIDTPAAPVEAVDKKPVKPKKKTEKQLRAERAQKLVDYFAPGNIVKGYGGLLDEVLAFHPAADGNGWGVTVQEVRKVGDEYVRVGKPQDARTHATMPDQRALDAGPVARVPDGEATYTESRADGKPFPNAPRRGPEPEAAEEATAEQSSGEEPGAEPGHDAEPIERNRDGRAERRAPLAGEDRWPVVAPMGSSKQAKDTAAAQNQVVAYMNGDITRSDLMRYLEESSLPQGVIYSITQRLVDDGPSIGEVDAMLERREKGEPAPGARAKPKTEKQLRTKRAAAPKKARKSDVESTAHGMLHTAKEAKAAAFKRVKDLRQAIKDAPIGEKSALRLDLIKAEDRWHEYQRMEASANSKIAEDAAAQGMMFSRTQAAGRVTAEDLRAMIDPIAAQWEAGPKGGVEVVQSVDDLPPHLANYLRSAGEDGRVEGFYLPKSDKVYLIADNLPSAGRAQAVVFHEVYGHKGMRAILPAEQYAEMMDRIRRANPKIARAADEWFEQYGVDTIMMNRDAGQSNAEAKRNAELLAVEEALADMAATVPVAGPVRKLLAALQAGLRKIGLQAVADWLEGKSEAETFRLLADARADVFGTTVKGSTHIGLPTAAAAFARDENVDAPGMQFSRSRDAAQMNLFRILSRSGKEGSVDTISGWDKTVGTQYNKALKDEHFGRVFGYALAMQNEVSMASVRPAELAPALLPKVDAFGTALRQLVLGRKRDKEMVGATNAIFAGTTAGSTVAQGQVWTPEELKEKFGLSARGIRLYQQARAAINASLDEVAAAEAYAMAQGFVPKGMRNTVMHNPAGARAALLSAIDQQIRMLERATKKSAGAKTEAERAEAIESALKPYTETRQKIEEIFDRADDLKKAGYAPLMRFGKYTVYANEVGPNGEVLRDEDDQPKTLYFGIFETEAEAIRAADKLRAKYADRGDVRVTRGKKDQKGHELFTGISPETVALFGDVIGKDEATQKFYQQALSERSALKRRLGRRAIEGYSTDLPRVLANFITSNGRFAAQRYYMRDLNNAIRAVPRAKGDVKDEAIALRNYLADANDGGAGASSIMFAYFLGGSVASAVVNLSQPFMMTGPYLAQWGAGRTAAAMAKAMPYALGKKQIADQGLREAMKRANQEGIVEAQEIFHLYSQGAQGVSAAIARRLASIPKVGAKLGESTESMRARMEGFMTLWGMMFAAAESFNRKLTFVAAWELAKATDQADPYEFAARAVNETQGIFNKVNRPNWARSTPGRLLMTFKQYSIMYLELLRRMWRAGPEGKKAVLMMMAVLFLASGEEGLPFAQDVNDLVDTIGQALGYDTNLLRDKRKWAHQILGRTAGDFALYGISSMMPLDFAGRVGLGNLIPGTGLLKPAEAKDRTREVTDVIGPAGALVSAGMDSYDAWTAKQPGRAVMAVMPKAVGNAAAGLEMAMTDKAVDYKGRKVTDVGLGEAVVKGLGFTPTKVAEDTRRRMPAKQDIALVKKVQGDIMDLWVRGLAERDKGMQDKAAAWLKDWNEKNPESPIIISNKSLISQAKQMATPSADRMLKGAPKGLRGRMATELRSSVEED